MQAFKQVNKKLVGIVLAAMCKTFTQYQDVYSPTDRSNSAQRCR